MLSYKQEINEKCRYFQNNFIENCNNSINEKINDLKIYLNINIENYKDLITSYNEEINNKLSDSQKKFAEDIWK